MFPLASDKLTPEFGGGLQHHLRDFTHHPSPVGLLMSILAQFTGKGYGTDTSGAFVILDLPADALIGKTFPEKVFYGAIIWAGHLVSDMAGSSGALGEGAGIPGPILSFLKELSALPVFKNEGADNAFSKWISKLFNGTLIRDTNGNPIRVDFRTEFGVADQILSQTKSVIANECLVRGYYFLSRLRDELSRNDVRSLKDLERIDVKRVIPTNERSLTRMLTISSSVFVLTNLGIAVGKAALASKGEAKRFAGGILLNLNFVGIARMAVAIASDSKYIAEDLKDYLNKRAKEMNAFTEDFKLLRLNDREARLLFSYQAIAVKKDIELTKNRGQGDAKSAWLEEFKTRQADQMSCDAATYFLDEESAAEDMQKASDEDISSWETLLAMELWLFKPYYPFDDDWKERLKGVKYKNDYAGKDFPNAQGVIDKKKTDEVKKAYKRFTSLLAGSRTKTAILALRGFWWVARARTAGPESPERLLGLPFCGRAVTTQGGYECVRTRGCSPRSSGARWGWTTPGRSRGPGSRRSRGVPTSSTSGWPGGAATRSPARSAASPAACTTPASAPGVTSTSGSSAPTSTAPCRGRTAPSTA